MSPKGGNSKHTDSDKTIDDSERRKGQPLTCFIAARLFLTKGIAGDEAVEKIT